MRSCNRPRAFDRAGDFSFGLSGRPARARPRGERKFAARGREWIGRGPRGPPKAPPFPPPEADGKEWGTRLRRGCGGQAQEPVRPLRALERRGTEIAHSPWREFRSNQANRTPKIGDANGAEACLPRLRKTGDRQAPTHKGGGLSSNFLLQFLPRNGCGKPVHEMWRWVEKF
jgi:hypothetical protein